MKTREGEKMIISALIVYTCLFLITLGVKINKLAALTVKNNK